jgi:adenosylhomocysteine nucleosidase
LRAPGVIPFAGEDDPLGFPADERLCEALVAAAAEVAPDVTVTPGRIASGDQFVCTQEARDRIIAAFGARCCEMEGVAIAQACWRNGVPFVVARAISDKADGSSTVEYPVFERQAAEHCAAIVSRAVRLIGQGGL